MKTVVIFLLLLCPAFAFSQNDTALNYRHLVPVQGANKAELFDRAKSWFSDKFMSSKLKLEASSQETGELKGKGEMIFDITASGKSTESKVTFDVDIKVVNTGYIFQVSNFIHQYINSEFTGFGLLTSSARNPVKSSDYNQETMNNLWQQAKHQAGIRIEPLMDKLKVKMKTKSSETTAGL
jgi:hypothetical protein